MINLRKLSVLTLGLAVGVVLAAPVSAQTAQQKQKKPTVARSAAAASPQYRGTDKFPAGPLYHENTWLGDDPDPFIRLQIQRDISGRIGGNI